MPHNPPLVLYIEDDGLLMNMYKQLFTIHGFGFAGAKDFDSGQKMIQEKNPDIVLLDLLLPSKAKWIPTDLNVGLGMQILEELKADPKTKHIPVVILSNIDEAPVVKEAEKLGAEDYLVKANMLPKETLAKVIEILEKHGIKAPCDPRKEKC